jgi:transposase
VANIICGVDVSSTSLDARIGVTGPSGQFSRTTEGIAALAEFAKRHGADLVVMEATGGFERLPFGLLWEQKMPCAIVNPRSVRRFAEAMGIFEKTDRIDCGVIAWYAETKGIVAQQPAKETQHRIEAWVTRLRQLTDARTIQLNQRRLVTDPMVLDGFAQLMKMLNEQIRTLENEVAALIGQDPEWRKLDEAFRTIKGVADRTVARLLAEIPEIGTLSNKAVAKLAGLAPIAHDSGKSNGKRPIRGGRANLRTILFVVAEIVRRHNDDFRSFAEKLNDAGKPKKVIRVALARKLLVRLNAKAREARMAMLLPT